MAALSTSSASETSVGSVVLARSKEALYAALFISASGTTALAGICIGLSTNSEWHQGQGLTSSILHLVASLLALALVYSAAKAPKLRLEVLGQVLPWAVSLAACIKATQDRKDGWDSAFETLYGFGWCLWSFNTLVLAATIIEQSASLRSSIGQAIQSATSPDKPDGELPSGASLARSAMYACLALTGLATSICSVVTFIFIGGNWSSYNLSTSFILVAGLVATSSAFLHFFVHVRKPTSFAASAAFEVAFLFVLIALSSAGAGTATYDRRVRGNDSYIASAVESLFGFAWSLFSVSVVSFFSILIAIGGLAMGGREDVWRNELSGRAFPGAISI